MEDERTEPEGGQDLEPAVQYYWYKYVADACALEVCDNGCHACIETCLEDCSSDCEKCTGLPGKTCEEECQ